MENINWIDIILGASVIISLLIGISRGLIKELLSLISWIIALYVAFHFSEKFSKDFLLQFLEDETISYVAAFGAIFLVAIFVMSVLNMALASLLKFMSLSGFDRALGACFGFFRGIIIGALIVLVCNITPFISNTDDWQTSRLAPTFQNIANYGLKQLPESIQDKISHIDLLSVFEPDDNPKKSEDTSEATEENTAQVLETIKLQSAETNDGDSSNKNQPSESSDIEKVNSATIINPESHSNN